MPLDEWNAGPAWDNAPDQFKYPWGDYWRGRRYSIAGSFRRPRYIPRYIKRRLSAFDRKMLDRITSSKKPEPTHPDQLALF